jgi:hypothetical protein
MIGHDTFDFGRPYLDRLLTKSNILKGNKMCPLNAYNSSSDPKPN